MVNYIRSDLDFILDQIKIAEAHAAGTPLYGPGGLVPAYSLSMGLRTVDGRDNNLLAGQESWGAADTTFPELLDPAFRPASAQIDLDGPGPGGLTAASYAPSNNPGSIVVDSSLRTISNLIVDQTLSNPAAILKALQMGGIAAADMPTVALVQAIYNSYKPFLDAEYQARVIAQNDRAAANALSDGDPFTAPGPAEQAALDVAATSSATHALAVDAMEAARAPRDLALAAYGIEMDGDNVHLPNVAPDAGLSAPFNSWFTLFGQFFDHGLDLVNKGGSGTVFVPLQPDDPLYVEGSQTNFMVLTRATVSAGADNIMGTADDVRPVNTTTSFVDQNQTYTSHSSHQVFLRQYVLNASGEPVATGKLIEGGGAQPGGMATWGEVKAQALLLGIQLTDLDVGNVPLLRTDQYGNFIPGPGGFAQVITGVGSDGVPNTADDIVVSGTPSSPVNLTAVGALRIGHAFLADIAHDAVPNGLADGDIEIGLANPGNGSVVYDNELLDAHFVAGDGRANENIGLTAVHHIFHSEHNRLVEHTMATVLADAASILAGGATQAEAVAFLNEWLTVDVDAVPVAAAIDTLVWDGERLFQAAKFGTEMQYQHLVFEDFARKIQPNIDFFVVPDGYHADINPSIVAEFAHVVYRFGHSMLTETIDRLDPSFNADQIDLIQAFLNPIEFDAGHTIEDGVAAGDIIRGMTRQVGNEIDEFVTSALRNNLLGLPLDLATINLARGRDAGVPSLNAARRDFFEASSHAPELKPYESWVEFAGNLKNEASVINFIAAYGLHPLIVGESTIEGKRAAAMAIIFGTPQSISDDPNTPTNEARTIGVPSDAVDFLNSTGLWSSLPGGVTITGLDAVDLWIGGLAEKILPFGGMLGSTFNFVFEVQLEQLQDGDRFYYLQRLDGLHLLSEMENNTFAKVISLNADAGHLPSDVFSTPGLILEVDRTKQYNVGLGESAGEDGILEDDPTTIIDESADNLGNDPTGGGILTPLVIRNNPSTVGPDTNYLRYTGAEHVLLGGTDGNDIIIGSEGDDTLYGDGGNDRLEGGAGNDSYIGGDGDDIITDLGGDDIIRAGAGNDTINAGQGVDLIVGDEGQDFIVLGADLLDEAFGGVGNDFVLGSKTTEQTLGGEGDDWIEVGAWTGAVGDNFDDQFARDAVTGHDVFHGDGGFDEFIGEGGDDIWVGSLGRGKFDGMSGFDWTTYTDMQFGVDADLNRLAFDANPVPPPNAALDTFSFVEGVSGSAFDDLIYGSDITAAEMPTEGFRGSVLNAEGIALINGLQAVVGAGVTSFDGGNILLGGAGSDVIQGRGGDDIIDGDKWLNVRISVRQNIGPNGGVGAEIDSADSMKDLVTEMFNGTYNPGQLQIVREILTANDTGEVDTAVFSGNLDEYTFGTDAFGRMTISHTGGAQTDGTDTITNIERLQFADQFVSLINDAATGAPAISDTTPTEGQVLTASIGTIADPNGFNPATVTYQWQQDAGAGFVNITGATSANFTPVQAHVNHPLRVVASFVDADGFSESLTSSATIVVGDLFLGTAGIDNVTGTAGQDNLSGLASDDILNGGAENDILNGGSGNDILDGGAGNDAMTGGTGNDTFVVDAAGDVVTEAAGAANGVDLVQTTLASYTLGANVENLTKIGTGSFTGTGNALDNVITGGAGIDTLNGGAGDDTLNGGAGNDGMVGGIGNDTYVVDAIGDTVLEGLGAGTDTVQTTLAAYTLAANLENLSKIGTGNFAGTGNASANIITGGVGNDTLLGLAGNDTLDGGLGNDTMNGGADNDTYVVDSITDVVVEAVGGGTDTVQTTLAAYTLAANLENLSKIGTGNFAGTGNASANVITGGVGNDTLLGLAGNDTLDGGLGNDTMNGGADNDTYVVDSTSDVIVEAVGGGTDTVQTSLANYSLAANVENLTLTGTAAINGNGNVLANAITGNAGANQLFGGGGNDTINGGDGADLIDGGTGNDSLTGGTGNEADTIIGGAGNDTIDVSGGNDIIRYTESGFGEDIVNNFDAVGGNANNQDLIDLSAMGITAGTFVNRVFESTVGNGTLLTIREGGAGSTVQGTIRINNVNANAIDVNDFILATNAAPSGGATANADTLNGGNGNDVINALAGNDTVNGGGGNDTITGGVGNDTTNGGAGDDTFIWNANAALPTDGRDIVNGGTEGLAGDTFMVVGNTTAETYRIYTKAAATAAGIVSAAATEIVVTRNGADTASIIAELSEIEEIRLNSIDPGEPTGSAGGDSFIMIGDFSTTSLRLNTITIDGEAGDDTIDISSLDSAHRIVFKSNGGNDTIIGTLRPQDVVVLPDGKTAADYVTTTQDGVTTMTSGDHSITFTAPDGMPQLGDDEGGGTPAPTIDESPDVAIMGTASANVLLGTSDGETIVALGGNDTAIGGAGADIMRGDEGDDFLSAGSGNDMVFGGAGNDDILGGDGNDMLYGDAGSDRVFGDGGNDMIHTGAGNDTAQGGDGNDMFVTEAGDGDDSYFGDAGSDTLDMAAITANLTVDLGSGFMGRGSASSSQTGNDTLWNVENVVTGSGNDTITANGSVNVMDGGAGNDKFRFLMETDADGDTIVGFQPGDKIDISNIDANSGLNGNQSFTLVTGSTLSGAAQLAVTHETRADGDYTVIEANVDANNDAELRLSIKGTHNLTASDFNL